MAGSVNYKSLTKNYYLTEDLKGFHEVHQKIKHLQSKKNFRKSQSERYLESI
jgi:hypothetical protein